MARVTVEDCVQQLPNRFELVMVAAQRAREISAGGELTVDRDRDKNPVVALREIADVTVDFDYLRANLVKSMQRIPEPDEPADETVREMLAADSAQQGVSGPEEDGEDQFEAAGFSTADSDDLDAGGMPSFEDVDDAVLRNER